jgi:DNA-binding NarL/FixJ family response regulator
MSDTAPDPGPVRLMLVDDHPLVRDGLRVRLEAVPGLSVVAEAGDAAQALEAARRAAPDLVLMDVGMKGVNGIEATRQLVRELPALKVLVLSMYDNAEYVREAMEAGARGYVLKDRPADEIVQAIRTVMAGGRHLSAGIAAEGGDALTPREREVLALIAEGLSSRDIGERLAMGVRTVETHRTNLRRKLDLGSPAALVRYAVERRKPRCASRAPGRQGHLPRVRQDFAKKVNDMAGGRLKIEVLPAGAVVPAFELLDAVSKGTLDGGHGVIAYWYGKNSAWRCGVPARPSAWTRTWCWPGTTTAAARRCSRRSTRA